MKRIALYVACAMLVASCSGLENKPKTKPPKIDEARVNAAKIGGRELPMYTFSARIADKENSIKSVRVLYKTGEGAYKTGTEGPTLVDPLEREAEYHAPQHTMRYISKGDTDGDLERYFEGETGIVAFRFKVDYTAPESTEVQTVTSRLYTTDKKNILRHNLSKEIK